MLVNGDCCYFVLRFYITQANSDNTASIQLMAAHSKSATVKP